MWEHLASLLVSVFHAAVTQLLRSNVPRLPSWKPVPLPSTQQLLSLSLSLYLSLSLSVSFLARDSLSLYATIAHHHRELLFVVLFVVTDIARSKRRLIRRSSRSLRNAFRKVEETHARTRHTCTLSLPLPLYLSLSLCLSLFLYKHARLPTTTDYQHRAHRFVARPSNSASAQRLASRATSCDSRLGYKASYRRIADDRVGKSQSVEKMEGRDVARRRGRAISGDFLARGRAETRRRLGQISWNYRRKKHRVAWLLDWPQPSIGRLWVDWYMRDLYPACNIGQWARAIMATRTCAALRAPMACALPCLPSPPIQPTRPSPLPRLRANFDAPFPIRVRRTRLHLCVFPFSPFSFFFVSFFTHEALFFFVTSTR